MLEARRRAIIESPPEQARLSVLLPLILTGALAWLLVALAVQDPLLPIICGAVAGIVVWRILDSRKERRFKEL